MKLFVVVVSFFAVWTATLAHAAGATVPGWRGQTSAPHLSAIVRQLTKPGAVVYCSTHAPAGNAGEAVKATREIVLAPDVCAALK